MISASTTPSEIESPIPYTYSGFRFVAEVENFLAGGLAGVKIFSVSFHNEFRFLEIIFSGLLPRVEKLFYKNNSWLKFYFFFNFKYLFLFKFPWLYEI